MKLVGATWGFIRKPFLIQGITHGFYASILAIGFLCGVIYLVQSEFYEVINFGQVELLSIIFGLVIITGIFINLVSTFLAVSKYLRVRVDELYY
jgi:cell division transport system permease protein